MNSLQSLLTASLAACTLVALARPMVSAQAPPPSAPSDAHAFGGVLSWRDNSSNETGLRVVVRLFGSASGTPDVEHLYDLPANETSFVLPPEALPDCDRSYVNWSVYAVNASALSQPAVASLVVECGSVGLPPAGSVGVGSASAQESNQTVVEFALLAFFLGSASVLIGWYRNSRRQVS